MVTKQQVLHKILTVNGKLNENRFGIYQKAKGYCLTDRSFKKDSLDGLIGLEKIYKALTELEKGLVYVNYSFSTGEPEIEVIENITKYRYSYFHFSKEVIQEIAHKKLEDVKWSDAAILVQALFPNNLICSGLIDCFLIFECFNGVRQDPPKYCYYNLSKRVNNCKNKDQLLLIEAIITLFEKNGIEADKSWYEYLTESIQKENSK